MPPLFLGFLFVPGALLVNGLLQHGGVRRLVRLHLEGGSTPHGRRQVFCRRGRLCTLLRARSRLLRLRAAGRQGDAEQCAQPEKAFFHGDRSNVQIKRWATRTNSCLVLSMFSSTSLFQWGTDVLGFALGAVVLVSCAVFWAFSLFLYLGFLALAALAERVQWLRETCLPHSH